MIDRPFVLARLDHVTLPVADMASALAFYVDVLGCTRAQSSPQYGMEFLGCGIGEIVLVDVSTPQGAWAKPARSGGRNMDHFCLAIGSYDPEQMRGFLVRNGVEIVEEAVHGKELSFYVRDPFSNQIELRGLPIYPNGREPAGGPKTANA